jgi:hypothetical protein
MGVTLLEGHMASYLGRRKFLAGLAARPLAAGAQQPAQLLRLARKIERTATRGRPSCERSYLFLDMHMRANAEFSSEGKTLRGYRPTQGNLSPCFIKKPSA